MEGTVNSKKIVALHTCAIYVMNSTLHMNVTNNSEHRKLSLGVQKYDEEDLVA